MTAERIHKLTLWATLLLTVAGGVADHVHLTSDETARAVARQRQQDALYQRLGNDEAEIAAIASQLPKDKRDLLDAIQRAQQNGAAQQQQTYFDNMVRGKAEFARKIATENKGKETK